MQNKRLKKGFTLAETLIVVAIIVVLAAVIVIAVFAYLRSMTKLEYDGYAKEIFIAAQNHLSMAESQGYLGRTNEGTKENKIDGIDDTGDGVYYFVKYNPDPSKGEGETTDNVDSDDSIFNLMLPFAAVDETVRSGGCYIIRYHKDSATVLDVFYWKDSGRFSHQYTAVDKKDYNKFITISNNDDNKNRFKHYDTNNDSGNAVIGWYGGENAKGLTRGEELKIPIINVINADQLKVTVSDPNYNISDPDGNIHLKLIVTGLSSGAKRELSITRNNTGEYELILDDITGTATDSVLPTESNKHFYNLFCIANDDSPYKGSENLIPGEDITIQAVCSNSGQLSNVAYSPIYTTNSLFAYNDTDKASAHISYIRHLENLDKDISNVDIIDTDKNLKHITTEGSKTIVAAKQTTDLSWDAGLYSQITSYNNSVLTVGMFKPVDPDDYNLKYDGQNHSVSNVSVNTADSENYKPDNKNAGLFAELTSDKVENLKLIDFSINGVNAGALAGEAGNDAAVTNVIAYNSTSTSDVTITGSGSVGGLIGSAENTDVIKSAAALVVKSTGGNAGGLVGTISGGSVSASYSGGHTVNGAYDSDNFNVLSTKDEAYAGGLVGSASGTDIVNSYSTCSVNGDTAGGLVGTINGGKAENCYSTGLVKGAAETKEGAFAGVVSGAPTISGCKYFEIINEQFAEGNDAKKGYEYMVAVGAGSSSDIVSLDKDASDYETFVGSPNNWNSAVAYDFNLSFYYQGKYNLKTAAQLGASVDSDDSDGSYDFVSKHYGDWPAPEIWVVNTPTP